MTKMSFMDKINVLIETSKNSYYFIIILIFFLFLAFVLFTTNKKNKKTGQKIFIFLYTFITVFLLIVFNDSLGKMLEYMMNNFFIMIYFPNLAIYLAAIIATNIILWISVFNFKTTKIIKNINIVIYCILNYILCLILNIISKEELDIFLQSSVYGNKDAHALIELSSIIFMTWITFLVIYKIILSYLNRNYKEKPKRIIIEKKVKQLPENFIATTAPTMVKLKPKKEELISIIKEEIEEKQLEEAIEQKIELTEEIINIEPEKEDIIIVEEYEKQEVALEELLAPFKNKPDTKKIDIQESIKQAEKSIEDIIGPIINLPLKEKIEEKKEEPIMIEETITDTISDIITSGPKETKIEIEPDITVDIEEPVIENPQPISSIDEILKTIEESKQEKKSKDMKCVEEEIVEMEEIDIFTTKEKEEIVKVQEEKVEESKQEKVIVFNNELDGLLTLNDYKLISKMLKEYKSKEVKKASQEVENYQFDDFQNLYRSMGR